MKIFRIALFSIITIMFFAPATIASDNGWYAGGFLGFVIPHDSDLEEGGMSATISYDTGFGIGAVAGYKYDNGFRAEGELSYRTADMDEVELSGFPAVSVDGDITALSLMANGYYDFRNDSDFTPYGVVGLGFTDVEGELMGDSEDDTILSFQVGFGLGYAMSKMVTIDLSYRYFGGQDADFAGTDVEVSHSNIQAGLLFQF